MSVCVVILSCDRYAHYWRGLWHFMERHWDFSIEAPIRLFNEDARVQTPSWCLQTLTGAGTFVETLRRSVASIEEDDIFLMLEDFWPIAPMKKGTFEDLYRHFKQEGLDALQVSNYTPYYTVEPSGKIVAGRELLEFRKDSEWIFNFQARFWRKDSLLRFLAEPELSERVVGSAITAEMEADKMARASQDLRVRLFHYLWYPLSGVSYRGELTEFGKHLQNIVEIDYHVDGLFSQRASSHSRLGCSA